MIIDKNKIEAIKERIRVRHNYFILKTLGPDQLSDKEIKELKDLGFDTSKGEDYVTDSYVAGATRGNVQEYRYGPAGHDEWKVRQPKIPLNDVEQHAVDHVKENTAQTVQRLSSQFQQKVEGLIRDGNFEHRNVIQTEGVKPAFVSALEEDKKIGEIVKHLREATGDFARDWRRVAITEMNNAQSYGAADAIVKRNKGKAPADETYVYKLVVRDAALCPYCRKFYLNPDGTPKIYKMSELMRNGTNYGKKASQWKPVIGSTHPNCRDRLVELPKGWGFAEKDKMEYVGPDYVHYHHQKKR